MATLTTAEAVIECTAEYRFISQTVWEDFIHDCYNGINGSFHVKGDIDVSTNPNYPAATEGDVYRVVNGPGKVGGASGIPVIDDDLIIAWADNPGGTQGAVGAFWSVGQVGLQQIFEISGNDLSFDVIRDLIQTIGRDWTVGTVRDKTETVGRNLTTNITGQEIRQVDGTMQFTVLSDYTETVGVGKYVKTITGVAGNVSETILGTETKETTGNLARTVNTNKYIFNVTAASGNTTETIAGTLAKNVTGLATYTYTGGQKVVAPGVAPVTFHGGATDFSAAFFAMQAGFGTMIGYAFATGSETSVKCDNVGNTTLKAANTFIVQSAQVQMTMGSSGFWKTTGNNNGIEIYANDTGINGFVSIGATTTPIVNIGTGGQRVNIAGLHIAALGLQDFATNAAALAGGLVLNDFYYTNVAGEAAVKIVI